VPVTTVTPELVIDDFKMDVVGTSSCQFVDTVWPSTVGNNDAAVAACEGAARPNRLGYCPNILAYWDASTNYGTICTSYPEPSDNDPGPFIRIVFDVSAPGGEFNDAFACYFETLIGTDSRPLSISALGLTHLTFWARASQPNANIEISLKDSANHETNLKKTIRDCAPTMLSNEWQKFTISTASLSITTSTVDLTSLIGIGFCFAHDHFSHIDPNTDMHGIVDIYDISFEP